ncbi:MAG: phosphate transport system protein [Acidimicrobiaceae bacterium]|jgi:phosphate transport system protein
MALVNRSTDDEVVDVHVVERLLVEMFGAVATGLTTASHAFLAGDRDIAREIVAGDRHIDDLLATVERMAEEGLVGPHALDRDDRRLLVYVLRTAPELERSADLVEHIALRTPQGLAELIPARARDLLVDMATLAAEMWCSALEGFVARDPSVGIMLQLRDEALDDLHVELTEELAESGCRAAVAIEMGLIARFYERLGDHAVNVANRAVNLIDF